MAAPTLINLPPPPSDPVTPSDMGPGTPNSGTTSLSALSTTAIKDGHQGHAPPHPHYHRHTSSTVSNSSTTTLDAERADRISRLAGLERVATVRQGPTGPTTTLPQEQPGPAGASGTQGYFDNTGAPVIGKERSTVGSASATGSTGARTTWASGSDDPDKMSEDDVSSTGFSDEGNASLVGFGETASSTISGPVSNPPGSRLMQSQRVPTTPGSPMQPGVNSDRAKMLDGVTYDQNIVDTTSRGPMPTNNGRHAGMSGVETSERIVRDRLNASGGDTAMDTTDEK